MEFWLAASPWPGAILWIVLYISDYALTLASARGFREISHFKFEGSFELTPQFEKDVDGLQPVSRRHVILLVLISLLIVLCWWLMNRAAPLTFAYLVVLGMFLLMEVPIHFRHIRNLSLVREIRKSGGVEGQIYYRRWFSYRMSALEFYMFAIFFLMAAALSYSPFFLGGAIACLAVGIRHNAWAKKAKSLPRPAA